MSQYLGLGRAAPSRVQTLAKPSPAPMRAAAARPVLAPPARMAAAARRRAAPARPRHRPPHHRPRPHHWRPPAVAWQYPVVQPIYTAPIYTEPVYAEPAVVERVIERVPADDTSKMVLIGGAMLVALMLLR